ncbi:MAG: hypothetical protein AB1725_02065 [Armatimonadota bacterium]
MPSRPGRKLICMAAATAAASLSLAQDHFVGTVDAYLERLSEGREQPLKTQPPMSGEVILVAAHGAGEEELMQRLAHVLHAEWKDGTLVRDSETANALHAKDRQERLQAVRTFITQRVPIPTTADLEQYSNSLRTSLQRADELSRNGYGSVSPPGANFRVPTWASVQTPAQVLLNATIRALGEETFADLPYYRTVMYSDRPTQVQRAIPNADELKRLLARLSALALEVLAEQTYSDSPIEPQVRDLRSHSQSLTDGNVSRLQLFLTRRQDDVMCLFVVYDGGGRFAGTASVRMPTRLPSDLHLPEGLRLNRSVRLSGLSHEVLAFLAPERMPPGVLPNPTAAATAAMFQPLKTDPLAFGVAEVLASVAEQMGVRLAACVQDSALNLVVALERDGSVDAAAFLSALADEHEISLADGWLLVRPRNPLNSERQRVPRDVLQRLMDRARAEKGLSLRAFAEYHFQSNTAAYRSPVTTAYQWFTYAFCGRSYPRVTQFENDDYALAVLMYIGSLREQEYALLTSGRAQFDLGSARPEQRDWIREIIGYRHLLLESGIEAGTTPEWLLTGSEAAPMLSLRGAVLTTERISQRAVVNEETRLREPDTLLNQPMTLDEIRASYGSWRGIELAAAMRGRYVVGTREMLWVTIHVRPGIVRRFAIPLDFHPETEPLRFSGLPEDVRRAFGVGG